MDKICDRCGKDLGESWVTWGDKKSGEENYCNECDCKLTGCVFCEEIDRRGKQCHLSEEQRTELKAIYFKDLDERMKHDYEIGLR
jgi:hypothetical protein